jgi:hypothetical protein
MRLLQNKATIDFPKSAIKKKHFPWMSAWFYFKCKLLTLFVGWKKSIILLSVLFSWDLTSRSAPWDLWRVSSYPDYEHKIFKGIKFIYLSDMARFLQENYSCIYSEGSDQNFDEETQGTGESRRGCNRKRLKTADGMRDHQVIDHVCSCVLPLFYVLWKHSYFTSHYQ